MCCDRDIGSREWSVGSVDVRRRSDTAIVIWIIPKLMGGKKLWGRGIVCCWDWCPPWAVDVGERVWNGELWQVSQLLGETILCCICC
jgi:hypothetical protein